MKQYVDVLKRVFSEGEVRMDRTKVGTLAIYGGRMEFDLRDFFPIVTLKKTRFIDAFTEMLWFIRGEPNTSYLKKYGIKIWDDWADKDGNLGPVYGVQWRSWPGRKQFMEVPEVIEVNNPQDGLDDGFLVKDYHQTLVSAPDIDQIKELLDGIKNNPQGRRHIVTAWNPADIHLMGLPPCHRDFQCYVSNDGHLDLMWSQRSWDLGLGAPYNIAQYALLTHLIARATNLKPRKLSVNFGDAHIYMNHVDLLREAVETREPINCKPQLKINTENIDIDGYNPEDFDIIGYQSHPFIKLPIAV